MKKTVYHGTTDLFYLFSNKSEAFFTTSIDYAYEHTLLHNDDIEDAILEEGDTIVRPIIAECNLTTNNLFDPRNLLELFKLKDVLSFKEFIRLFRFKNGCWRILEKPVVIQKLKDLQYDGHLAKELDEITYCIYNPMKHIRVNKYIGFLTAKEYEEIYDH